MTRRGRLRHSVGIAAVLVGVLSVLVADNSATADDVPIQQPTVSSSLEREGTYVQWGQYDIAGGFVKSAAVGDDRRMVAIEGGRLVRIDINELDVVTGDAIPGHRVKSLVVSEDGSRVFVGTGSGLSTITEYSTDTLTSTRTFSASIGDAGLVTVAGAPGTVLVASTFEVVAFVDGSPLPMQASSRDPRAGSVVGVVALSEGRVLIRSRNRLAFYVLGPTGLSLEVSIPLDSTSSSTRPGPFGVVLGLTAYDTPNLVGRPATDFDRSVADPDGTARYFGTDSRFTIFRPDGTVSFSTAQSGCGVTAGSEPHLLAGGRTAAGGAFPAPMRVTSLLRRCGSYGEFTALDPSRIFDSRSGQGRDGNSAQILGGETLRIKVHGEGGVPDDNVESAVLNITAVDQRDGPSYVTVWPAGFDQPTVANLIVVDGEVVGNMVTVSTAAGGYIDVFSLAGTVDIVIDVMGYFSGSLGPEGARYLGVPNTRLLDTRSSSPLAAGKRLTLEMPFELRIDGNWTRDDVTAVVLNVTAVDPSTESFLAVFPAGAPTPDASSMNFIAGRVVNRLVTVKLSESGAIDILNAAGRTDVTVDLVGVYANGVDRTQQGRFVGAIPFRLYDSRESSPFPGDGKTFAGGELRYSGLFPNEDLVVNLVATEPEGPGFFSAGPTEFNPDNPGLSIGTSSLNYLDRQTIGNQSIINTGFMGEVGVYSLARSHMIIDVFGYYTSDN